MVDKDRFFSFFVFLFGENVLLDGNVKDNDFFLLVTIQESS